ncbi:hypothetical protein ACFL6X_07000 [Candidatus Latescibacterota bacterium]
MNTTDEIWGELRFQEPRSVELLREEELRSVPSRGGVYAMLNGASAQPQFLPRSPGGWFKGRDPTVSPKVLQANWIAGAPVVYIGKGQDLRRRLSQFLRFGSGSPVGHWGGRLVWQISGVETWQITWAEVVQPRVTERAMLAAFEDDHGALPFANLQH